MSNISNSYESEPKADYINAYISGGFAAILGLGALAAHDVHRINQEQAKSWALNTPNIPKRILLPLLLAKIALGAGSVLLAINAVQAYRQEWKNNGRKP